MTDSDEDFVASSDEEQQPVFEPLIGGRQLIGDDFFMQLAEWKYNKRYTGRKLTRMSMRHPNTC